MEEDQQYLQPPVQATGSGLTSYGDGMDEVLNVLFPQGIIPGNIGPDEAAYLSRLGAQGLESLMGEVARVNEELAIIEHQTRDMASQNYQIFVQSAQTTNLIKKSLSEAKSCVENLSSTTFPDFKTKTETFVGVTGPCAQFQQNMTGVQSLLEKEVELNQVLDMPWVVRRCLAAGEDKMLPAIKILHIVMDYKKSMGTGGDSGEQDYVPPALAETISSVLQLQTQIQSALLQKLHSPSITLSECLQSIQLLRNFFPSDKALRFRFLQSRNNPGLAFENARSWIFDTLTQHRAAFGQDSSHYLSTFIALQIQRVLLDLNKQLETSGQNLDSLFMNASYFGESLARVGADLRGLSVPLFSDFLVKKGTHELLQAEMNFSRNLHQFNLSTCLIQQRVEQLGLIGFEDPSAGELPSPLKGNDYNPPPQLLTFHPLAIYCNDVLTLLNFIGKCPLSQSVDFSRKLNQSVSKIGHELEGWSEGEWVTWEQREQQLFYRMRSFFEQLLVPHVDKCFRKIFPPEQLASITGLNVSKCAEMTEIRYSRPIKA
ncbi:conserved oligomeric Golgi complex subunit 8 isoform X2 [Folsomia candida]|uniref:conserved oligomeric Golgi complex subunit 8 isoform X2 n=1 Tax=Folsomia candida TaxID=158441 RepID=UPI000B8F48A5|nr:conserved oligomeric Golgi complex subunit 8 isoform X2 [Folsomia candida]